MENKRYCMYFAKCATRFNLKAPNFQNFPPKQESTALRTAQIGPNSACFIPPTKIFWIKSCFLLKVVVMLYSFSVYVHASANHLGFC